MSAMDAIPRSPRAASMRGPTPGSSVTGRERRSVRVVRSGRTASVGSLDLEVGHAISSQANVGSNDPPDLCDELLLDPELLGQFGEELGGGDVPEVDGLSCLHRWPDLLDDGRHLPLASAGTLERHDLTANHLEYGPDIERRTYEALCSSNAPALRKVLKRADSEEQVGSSDGPLRGASDLVEIPPLVDTAEGFKQDQTGPHLGAPGVEHVYGSVHHPCRLRR